MIQLEMTVDEFEYLLEMLTERLQNQQVSDAELEESINTLRQSSADEMLLLCKGLLHKEIDDAVATKRVQALNYLYVNGELTLLPGSTRDERYIASKIHEEVLRPFQVAIMQNKWLGWLLFFAYLAALVFLWNSYGWLGKSCLMMLPAALLLHGAARLEAINQSARYAFLKLLIKHHIPYRQAFQIVKNMTERITTHSRTIGTEKQLYTLLASKIRQPFSIRSKHDIEIELEKILQLLRIPITRYNRTMLPSLLVAWIVCVVSFFLFPGLSWFAASLALLKVTGLSLLTMIIGTKLFQIAVIYSARRVFLNTFAVSASQYQRALRMLDEYRIREWRIGVFWGIGDAFRTALDIKILSLDNHQTTSLLRMILFLFERAQTAAILFFAFITWGSFVATPFMTYFFVFTSFTRWQTGICAFAALCPAFLGLRYLFMPVGDYIAVVMTTRLAVARFLEVFPRLHENYAKAISLLKRFAALERRGQGGLYRVEKLLYSALEEDAADPTNHPIKNVFSRMLSAGMSLLAFAALFWRLTPLAWWQTTLCCVLTPVFYQIFRLLLGYAARFHAGLGVIVLKEQTYYEQASRQATEVFIGKSKTFRRHIPFLINIAYAILWAYRKKAADALAQKEWTRAERLFAVAFSNLEYLMETNANVASVRTKLATAMLPALSDDLQAEFAETSLMIGVCQHLSGKLLTARKTLEKSHVTYQTFASSDANAHQEQRARLAAHLGICCCQLGDFAAAQLLLDESHASYQSLGDSFRDELIIVKMWRELAAYFLGEITELSRLKIIEDEADTLSVKMRHAELLELASLAQSVLAHHLAWVGSLQLIEKRFREQRSDSSSAVAPAAERQNASDIAAEKFLGFDEHEEAFLKDEDTKAFFKKLFPDLENEVAHLVNKWEEDRKQRVYHEEAPAGDCFMRSISLFGALRKRRYYEELAWYVEPILPSMTKEEYHVFSETFSEAQDALDAMVVKVQDTLKKDPDLQSDSDKIMEMGRFNDYVYLDMRKLTRDQKKRLRRIAPLPDFTKRMFQAIGRPFFRRWSQRAASLRWQERHTNWWSVALFHMSSGSFGDAQKLLDRFIEYHIQHETHTWLITWLMRIFSEPAITIMHDVRHELLAAYLARVACLLEENEADNVVNMNSVMRDLWILLERMHEDGQLSQAMMSSAAIIAEWHVRRARLADQREDERNMSLNEALRVAETAIGWSDQSLRQVASQSAQRRLAETHFRLHQMATVAACALRQFERAYLLLERGKTRVLTDQLHDASLEPGEQVPPALRKQWRSQREKLSKLEFALTMSVDDLQVLRHAKNTTKQINEKISKLDPAFAAMTQPQPLTRRDFSPLLADDELALAFAQSDDMLRIYPITKRRGVHAPLMVAISAIAVQERVEQFHHHLAGGQIDRENGSWTIGAWLTETIGGGLQDLIKHLGPKQLVFVPHQNWHLLPLHLISFEADHPLAMRYAVRYLPSLSIFSHLRRVPSQTGDGCIIANPEGNLPSAETECAVIKAMRPNDQVLMGSAATQKAVLSALRTARNIHFACHGVFEPNLDAKLCLASKDGLSARELFSNVRFVNQPRLTVLSACETAQVQATKADEYRGLASAFLYAGTRNVVASLWRVEAEATRILMEYFYRNIETERLSLPDALRKAQQQLREHDTDYEIPYYWAGFILIGEESGQACEGVNPPQG